LFLRNKDSRHKSGSGHKKAALSSVGIAFGMEWKAPSAAWILHRTMKKTTTKTKRINQGITDKQGAEFGSYANSVFITLSALKS